MKIEVRYSWRYKWAGRMTTSRIKMTEEQALRQNADAVRLDHTREEVTVMDQPCEIDQANIDLVSRGIGVTRPRLSRLCRPKTVPQEGNFVPLPMTPEFYRVEQDGDIWTVKSTNSQPHRVVYQGRGPVTVEAAP
ncbi:MAG: hypothetical protein EON54_02910 [Alcaligenaceae bacterium]|nr:MAG: hypothetical protein EON54_02910 [Alcaligenaceae bacterium]